MLDFDFLKKEWLSRADELLGKYEGIVLACSGGIDSTVMLELVSDVFSKNHSQQIDVAHVNYGLRGAESDKDRDFVEGLARKYGYKINILNISEEQREQRETQGIQEWARDLRYEFFYKAIKDNKILALAHNQDDVAENAILRLARGASAGNLAGMKEFAPPFWRPLLNVPRADIVEYAKLKNISHREDSSNQKLDYNRNIIRHKILPPLNDMYNNANQRIAFCASEAQDIAEFCTYTLERQIDSFPEDKIPVKYLLSLKDGVAFHLLKIMLSRAGHAHLQFSRVVFKTFLDKLKSGDHRSGKWSHDLPHGIKICYEKGFIFVK